MDEFISKHEAYKMLKDKQAAYMQVAVNEAFGTAARMIDQMKPAEVQPISRWINIKDKLPEEDGAYLCYLESGIVCEANYDSTIASEGEFPFGEWVTQYNSDTLGAEDNYWVAYDAITHWMELPNPPKDGDVE